MGMCLMRWSVPVHGTHTDTWNGGDDRRKGLETCLFHQWSVTKRNGRPAGYEPAGCPFVYIYFTYSLSQNRIREQYLVIDRSVHLHGCLRHHELYAFPLHLRLPHEPVHDKPREESRTPLSFHTMNPSSSVVWQIYQSPVSSSCAKLTRPPPRTPKLY